MTTKDFVIIGGGIAGLSAIKAIKDENKTVSIMWVTNEDRLPYKRTQINKNISSGFEKNDFALIDHDWLVDNQIELLFDQVEFIDTEKHELTFQHRGHLKYKKLILATGNTPNSLQIKNLPNDKVLHIFTARQAENIIRTTTNAKKYLIIGAGVEGVEMADQLNKLNKEVVLIDKSNHLLSRYFTNYFSELIKEEIENAGIKLILGAKKLTYKEGESDRAIITIKNKEFEFDHIISTIGYSPNIKLADDSYIKCNHGILVNEYLQTSEPDIFAAGDVAEHTNGLITGLWHAAEKQGFITGKNCLNNNQKIKLLPFRMKTEVFNEFFFSVPPTEKNLELIKEDNNEIKRHMYFKNNKLQAILVKNDKERAKYYQQALMEKWELSQIHERLPLSKVTNV